MLFLTTVKVFLSSVSFKALVVLKGFRNCESLGTRIQPRVLRYLVSGWSREVIGHSLGHFIYGSVGSQSGKETWIYQIGNLISLTASAVQCHVMDIHFTC